nr:ABC transporter permease [Pseudoalteromonas sp. HF66]
MNILGLIISLISCLIIWLFVEYEYSFDKYQPSYSDSYRVVRDFGGEGVAVTPYKLNEIFKNEFNKLITDATSFSISSSYWSIYVDNEKLSDINTVAAEENIAKFFDFEILYGESFTALNNSNSVFISDKIALRIFGHSNAVGKKIFLNNSELMVISGVFKSPPSNTHTDFEVIFSMNKLRELLPSLFERYNANFFYTYLKVKSSNSIKSLESKSTERYQSSTGTQVSLKLQPITDIHLNSDYQVEIKKGGSILAVKLAIILGLSLLILSCFNFVNLYTALSTYRLREIGIRRVLGASNGRIFFEIITESVVYIFISIIFSLLFVYFIIPISTNYFDKYLYQSFTFFDVLKVLSFTIIVGLITGAYPAYALSNFSITSIIKGELTKSKASANFRKSLVVIQSTVCIGTSIIALLFSSQMSFLKNIDIGFDKNNIIVFPELKLNNLNTSYESFRNRVLSVDGVESLSFGEQVPSMEFNMLPSVYLSHRSEYIHEIGMVGVHYDFSKVLDLKIISGRTFSDKFQGDYHHFNSELERFEGGVLISKSAALIAGWKNPTDAIGQSWEWGETKAKVVGVFKDINFTGINESSKPMFLALGAFDLNKEFMILKFKDANSLSNGYSSIQEVFRDSFYFKNVNLKTLDSMLLNALDAEYKQLQILMILSIFMIVVSSLGLIGLTFFSCERAKSDVAMRKVLGAEPISIVMLEAKKFILPTILALFLAWPISYFLGNLWLSNYSSQVKFSIFTMLTPTVAIVLLFFMIIGLITYKYSAQKPLDSIKRD